MRRHERSVTAAIAGLLVVMAGGLVAGACRPDSITAARDRLSSTASSRTVVYRLPLARESYRVMDFLDGTETVILDGGVVAVPVLPDTVRAPVGEALSVVQQVELEEVKTVASSALELGELASAVAASELRTAPIPITISSTSDAPLALHDPRLVLVRTEPDGTPVRDASGDLVPETDGSGDTLSTALGDTVELPPADSAHLRPEGAALVDRMAEKLVADSGAAVALVGRVTVSAADQSRVDADDRIFLAFRPLVGLDLVPPDTGVVVRRRELGEGLGFPPAEAAHLQNRVVRAGGRVLVTNGIPFRLRVELAYVGGSHPDTNVFRAGDRVVLDSLQVRGGASGGNPAADTLDVTVSGDDLGALLGDSFTASIRIRLLPGRGSARGGALRAGEQVGVDARARMEVRSGNGGGG